MAVHVAIIGAGPAGFYAAEALIKRRTDVSIDIIERLHSPFGLIRAGVAPDHQSTKRIARRFEETADSQAIRFYGNVEIGRDVTLEDLHQTYDAVVLAVGSARDRHLGIPGEDLGGVYGSAAFIGWYNGHPDFRDLDPKVDTETAVVVGNGNVALDIARVLAKSRAEMATSDITEYAGAAIDRSSIRDIYILGRRGPADSKFTPAELREIARLETCSPIIDASDLSIPSTAPLGASGRTGVDKNLALFRQFAESAAKDKPKRLRFVFCAQPTEIVGESHVEALRFEHARVHDGRLEPTGQTTAIPCGLVVVAIGYKGSPIPNVPYDADRGLIANTDGRVSDRLYAVGWAKRGPTGVIGTNKPDGELCAEQICQDIVSGTKLGRRGFEALLSERSIRSVSFDDWLTIDAAEIAMADPPAPRRKITSLNEIFSLIDRESK